MTRRRIGSGSRRSESDQNFRRIFEQASWGVFQTSPAGKYILANTALAAIYGYDSPEALVAEVADIGRDVYVDPGRRDLFIRQVREHGYLAGFESQIRRRDGRIIWISESCREVRDASGELMLYEGTVEDISARKQTEADLFAARALAEQSSKAKTIFLANMSHELRTPLNAILGFSELMEQELYGPLGDARYVEFVGDILRSGRQLLEIIGNILDIAKMEAGELALDVQDTDLSEIMRASEWLIAEMARQRGITLDARIPTSGAMVNVDSTRLRQVFVNLLSNAVKFTPEGGKVVFSCRRDRNALAVVVADTGIGMGEAELADVAKPFHQADSALSRRYDGAGLGLPLSQSLVELHGGTLTIESLRGVGTTVTVRLPATRISHWGNLIASST